MMKFFCEKMNIDFNHLSIYAFILSSANEYVLEMKRKKALCIC